MKDNPCPRFFISATILLGGALLLADTGQGQKTASDEKVQIIIDAGSGRFVQGEQLKIKCTLKNVAGESVVIPQVGLKFYDRALTITDESGKPVQLTSFGQSLAHCTLEVGADTLAAKHQRVDFIEAGLTHDLTLPGKYTVLVTISVSRLDDSEQRTVQSNKVDITIAPAADEILRTSPEAHDDSNTSLNNAGKPRLGAATLPTQGNLGPIERNAGYNGAPR